MSRQLIVDSSITDELESIGFYLGTHDDKYTVVRSLVERLSCRLQDIRAIEEILNASLVAVDMRQLIFRWSS